MFCRKCCHKLSNSSGTRVIKRTMRITWVVIVEVSSSLMYKKKSFIIYFRLVLIKSAIDKVAVHNKFYFRFDLISTNG